ncbi:Spb1 C-terminal domain-containing protein [Suillus lakei]|nr:Spb1 C-terminal domain-containing protein [Suillus lakei]
MGKAQKKTGKGRLDKYYKLAKEQGYRARSAFKLIQLNKKYTFLESARCCIDLCAAPGGWLQVASKYMPTNSVIVGVDLVPIKPIPRVVTFAADITTTQCRNLIRSEIKDWKADVVLHDGAPNVGTAWVQDAYSQSELVLMSLKLAVEFLVKGGTFVTKVFRSVDYNNLIWVFNQLFGKVEATKPPSSRNVSAEIFVVCRDFLAPKHIDPKFLDPKHVFKDLSTTIASGTDKGTSANNAQANVFQPEKKRRKRDGYDDGDYLLFKKASAGDFIRSAEPIGVLGLVNKITFELQEEKEWLQLDITTSEVQASCEDLKVLGKGDFKNLLRWRTALRQEIGLDVKAKDTQDVTETVEITDEVDEEQQIRNELERLNGEAAARTKRERRRANEIKTKTIQRMQLQMTAPLDIGLEQIDASLGMGQEDMFDLTGTERQLRNRGGIGIIRVDDDTPEDEDEDEVVAGDDEEEEVLDSEEERDRKASRLEAEMDGLYDAYQEKLKERDSKFQAREVRQRNGMLEEWSGIREGHNSESDEEGGWDRMEAAKGDNDDSSDDSDDEEPETPGRKRRRPQAIETKSNKKVKLVTKLEEPTAGGRASQVWFSQDLFGGVEGLDDIEDDDDEDDEEEGEDVDMASVQHDSGEGEWQDDPAASSDGDFEVVPQRNDEDDIEMWDAEGENHDETKKEHIKKYGLTTVESVSIAQRLVNRQTTKTHLLNDGFNRYSLNAKDGLPSWFLDDEGKHYKPNIPVTKEAIAALRTRQRALDARPIKKVAEAKGRKKLRATQRLEKAMKKAEGVNETSDMSEREKAKQIEKLMRKGTAKANQKKETKVVVAKGAHKGVQGRPKGVKGRYVMVDARMRKETRAKKRRDKANKKRR